MEQHTWPIGSDGRQPHPFSCIPSSQEQRRNAISLHKQHPLHRRTAFPGEHSAIDPLSSMAEEEKEKDYAAHSFFNLMASSRRLPPRCKVVNNPNTRISASSFHNLCSQQESSEKSIADYASLPFDVLVRIGGPFSWPTLWSASRVCRSWNQGLAPLREAMLYVHQGKKFKHGRGVEGDVEKALDLFLKGAVRGCTAAMVDAGLLFWELGRREEGIRLYRQAAELGDPAGQCNLGLAYLQHPSDPTTAVKWFHRAALAGHVRSQYSLALCLQQGKGIQINPVKAARWYLKAAEGGNARAMHNIALCYSKGEGMPRNRQEARRWMKRAALAGHHKAQYDYGLTLFSEGEGGLALVFLELATRAGETAATHLRDALLEELSPKMRAHAITCADKWQMKQNLDHRSPIGLSLLV